jgi:phosphoribosylformylglycinamidine (FGAM) synthase-like enzyme
MDAPLSTTTDAERLNISTDEYTLIQQIIGRIPNELELEIFALLWSEHACYKNSLKWLDCYFQKRQSGYHTRRQGKCGCSKHWRWFGLCV